MKKLVLILFVFASSTLSTLANVENVLMGGVNIRLSCSYVHHDHNTVPVGRGPMRMPEISISESSVDIEERLVGYTMILLYDGEVVCEQFSTSTHIVLPFNLSGDYEIRFSNDQYCFYGFFSF